MKNFLKKAAIVFEDRLVLPRARRIKCEAEKLTDMQAVPRMVSSGMIMAPSHPADGSGTGKLKRFIIWIRNN